MTGTCSSGHAGRGNGRHRDAPATARRPYTAPLEGPDNALLPGPERRLTAILSADIAGYSRLTAEDEDATIQMVNARRGLRRGRT